MKDKNITFNENFACEENIKGKRSLVYSGYLDEKIIECPSCHSLNIIKFGTKTSDIKIPKISELNAYLRLRKQRYQCKHCMRQITSSTNEVNYRCRISNNTKLSIINYSKETISFKLISKIHNVSDMSVQRINNKVYDNDKLYKHHLPTNMCFDEFHFKTRIMSFNICDADTGKTVDILFDRKQDNLNKYFSYYSDISKSCVENIVIDMYKPYISLVTDNFPNANIIIDLFHLVQLISKAMNKTRIKHMKNDKLKYNYNKMKRYWRLLLKSRFDLDTSVWKKYTCFSHLMTEVDVVEFILRDNIELSNTYHLYQEILYALQSRNYELLSHLLDKEHTNISSYLLTSINTLIEFLPYIKNTLSSTLSNGVMERNNNTIKLLKRIAFGFRNFINFKARILVVTSLFRSHKKNSEFSFTIP